MNPARIVLADDHRLFLDTLKNFLEPEFEVAGTFTDGLALVRNAPKLNPDVIVLDIGMPLMNGLNAGQRLKERLPKTKLIYLTMNMDREIAEEAFRLGASAYLVKSSAGTELVEAIHQSLRGKSYITALLTEGVVGSFIENIKRKQNPDKLTLRQREVLQLLAEGRTMKEVAFMLNVSQRTVAFHKYSMMEQLRLKNSAELIQFAVKNSIVIA
ncbi:MAG TPA: response regulator transcription factor [Pyrinomonadaceae bacterium]|nr:response regulator transcription factor [Pyrinomonadaceae bacterium]